ncbi:hypothetical protein [Catellatospora chokoriensis]|uniref:hypothetical protein n=1 Tax=Catellatospora chokoriensis TaxID=310353 RepID=UPI00177ED18B|nr:hypothetical protein [Catellatospora chokoriensis]
MRRSRSNLGLLTVAWLLSCVVLAGIWFFTGFSMRGGRSTAEIHAQGFLGMLLCGVALVGAAALGLTSVSWSMRRTAIAFGIITVLLVCPVGRAAIYFYKQLRYQPCTTVSVLWDCPTDLD